MWETLRNTSIAAPSKFVLILDEAHRGSRGKDAQEAETIMQKFMKGNGEINAVALVVGISATPDKFVKLCNDTKRPLRRVDIDPARVRESGLLKEYVDLFHPDEVQPSRATMLREAIASWKEYCKQWADYEVSEDEEIPNPVLLVQVEDARAGAATRSATDLAMVVEILVRDIEHDEGEHVVACPCISGRGRRWWYSGAFGSPSRSLRYQSEIRRLRLFSSRPV